MSKRIKVLSRIQAAFAISQGKSPFRSNPWGLISIFGDDGPIPKPLYKMRAINCTDVMEIYCHDIVNPIQGYVMFSEKDAQRTIEFIDSLHQKEHQVDLVVHCNAGISRSGAVGTFACDYLQLDYKQFIDMNRGIQPNSYILDLLRRQAGISINEKNSAFNYFS